MLAQTTNPQQNNLYIQEDTLSINVCPFRGSDSDLLKTERELLSYWRRGVETQKAFGETGI